MAGKKKSAKKASEASKAKAKSRANKKRDSHYVAKPKSAADKKAAGNAGKALVQYRWTGKTKSA